MATAMSIPLRGSYSVTNSYAQDNERYFHYPLTDKWSKRIVKYNPFDGTSTIMELPDVISMKDSDICQISDDVFHFSSLIEGNPVQVTRIQNLSSGYPTFTSLPPLDRHVQFFSLAID